MVYGLGFRLDGARVCDEDARICASQVMSCCKSCQMMSRCKSFHIMMQVMSYHDARHVMSCHDASQYPYLDGLAKENRVFCRGKVYRDS